MEEQGIVSKMYWIKHYQQETRTIDQESKAKTQWKFTPAEVLPTMDHIFNGNIISNLQQRHLIRPALPATTHHCVSLQPPRSPCFTSPSVTFAVAHL